MESILRLMIVHMRNKLVSRTILIYNPFEVVDYKFGILIRLELLSKNTKVPGCVFDEFIRRCVVPWLSVCIIFLNLLDITIL